jgi:catechol-2,3-dioxygenase
MMAWYKLVLNGKPVYETPNISFLGYDEEHHRIAFINVPGLQPLPVGIVGVHHVAFTFASLRDLLSNFAHLKQCGVEPAWSVNHGPTTSLYYVDPDGNQLEFQVDNYANIDDATKYMFSNDFDVNPIGVDFDPEELLKKLLAGEMEDKLKLRPMGVERGVDGIPIK